MGESAVAASYRNMDGSERQRNLQTQASWYAQWKNKGGHPVSRKVQSKVDSCGLPLASTRAVAGTYPPNSHTHTHHTQKTVSDRRVVLRHPEFGMYVNERPMKSNLTLLHQNNRTL